MNKGFIALTITLSITGTLLTLVGASLVSTAVYYDMALKKEYREMNYYFAYNCIDQAILKLAHDYFFLTLTPIFIQHFNCSILSITKEGDNRTITTRGDYKNAYVYRSAIIKLKIHDLEVVKIE